VIGHIHAHLQCPAPLLLRQCSLHAGRSLGAYDVQQLMKPAERGLTCTTAMRAGPARSRRRSVWRRHAATSFVRAFAFLSGMHAVRETPACIRPDAVHHAALQASHVLKQSSSRPTPHAASVTMSSPKGVPLHVAVDPSLTLTRSCCLTMQHGVCMQEHQARQGRAGEKPVHGEWASGSAHWSSLQVPMTKM
jgi:hypothetical protein